MLHVDRRDPTPIPAQIERSLRAALAQGLLRPGDPLPAVPQLAVSLRLNANIVARAYRELEQAGLVELRTGLGAFVRGADGTGAGTPGREALLREAADRLLAEAARVGYTLDDVLTHLHGRRTPDG